MPSERTDAINIHPKRRLRNFLINPRFQLKYIFWISSTGLLLVTLNAVMFYSYTQENYAFLVDLSPMTDEARAQLYSELNAIIFNLAGISAGFLAIVMLIGIVISHRTAGPLYQFKKVFTSIRDGNREARIHLRPGDEFQDVAQTFNEMMDRVCGKG